MGTAGRTDYGAPIPFPKDTQVKGNYKTFPYQVAPRIRTA
jgi:hypothetical protein